MQRRNGRFEMAQTKNASLRAANFSRILLIKPSALGDVVHTLPVLVKLRARYPRARIDWLITPENAEVVRYHPALSNVVLFARRDFSKRGRLFRSASAEETKRYSRQHADGRDPTESLSASHLPN